MTVDYLAAARAAAAQLTGSWFTADTPGDWVPQDYWKTPTIAAELVTFMALAGNQDHLDICDAALGAGECCLTTSGYLDDATVWGRFHVAAYRWLTAAGNPDAAGYLADATTVCDDLQQQWTATCGGGLDWKRDQTDPANFKATNATLGLMEIALGLYQATGQPDRLRWAQRAWAWIAGHPLVDAQGLVWGGLTPQCVLDTTNVPVVALQGNPLQPLWWLYQATGDTTLLDAAQRIVAGTLSAFTWSGTQVLATPADAGWTGGGETYHQDHLNETLFKGIFCGFAGPFTRNLSTVAGYGSAVATNAAAIRANGDALLANYPGGIYGMDWHTADPGYRGDADDMVNACLQYSGLAALDAAAAVAGL
jgi:hypothetical protein